MNEEIKRLLKLAAKAAGIVPVGVDYGVEPDGLGWGLLLACGSVWNPRDDDGDSRRLEVALGIGMRHHQGWSEVFHPMIGLHEFKHGDCAVAATRLAVLRAAAAIGEAMP